MRFNGQDDKLRLGLGESSSNEEGSNGTLAEMKDLAGVCTILASATGSEKRSRRTTGKTTSVGARKPPDTMIVSFRTTSFDEYCLQNFNSQLAFPEIDDKRT